MVLVAALFGLGLSASGRLLGDGGLTQGGPLHRFLFAEAPPRQGDGTPGSTSDRSRDHEATRTTLTGGNLVQSGADDVGKLRTDLAAEREKAASLQQELEHRAKELADTASALQKRDGALEQQLADERARSSELEYNLSKALTQLAYAGRSSTDPVVEQARAKDLSRQQAAAQKTAQQIAALQKQLADVQSRATSLEGDLVATRAGRADDDAKFEAGRARVAELGAQLAAAEAGADKAATLSRQLSESQDYAVRLNAELTAARTSLAAKADAEAKLRSEQAHTAQLNAQLTAAEASAGQVGALQQQLSDSRSRATNLGGELAAARAALAAKADGETEREAEQARVATLGAKLAAAEANAGQVDALQRQLAESRSRATSLDGELATARAANLDSDTRLKAEQARVAKLDAELAAAEASVGQVDALQRQLAESRSRATSLGGELATARAANFDSDTRRKAEQARVTELGAELAAAKASVGQVGALQQQLSDSRTRATSLDGELAAARAANLDSDTRLKAEQVRVTELGAKLTQAQANAGQVGALQQELSESQGRVSDLGVRLAAVRAILETKVGSETRLGFDRIWNADLSHHLTPPADLASNTPLIPAPEAAHSDNGGTTSRQPASGTVDTGHVASAASDSLPHPVAQPRRPTPTQTDMIPRSSQGSSGHQDANASQALTRVTLRYTRNDPAAQGRATTLRAILQEKGWDVTAPEAFEATSREHRVTYYYGEDRPSAELIASLSGISGIVRGRLTAKGPLPRPGTVEVGIFPLKQ